MPKPPQILVVDDEFGIRELLSFELSSRGYKVITAANGQEALEKLSQNVVNLIISDVKMPKLNGIDFLDAVKKLAPDIEVILATGFGTVETAVSAMKKGAYDFIQKPFNLSDMFLLVEKALDRSQIKTLIGVYETSKIVFSSGKSDILLTKIAEVCRKSVGADDGCVYIDSQDIFQVEPVFVGKLQPEDMDARLSLCRRVLSEKKEWRNPVVLQKNSGDVPPDADPGGKIKSSIFYPLVSDNRLLGLLNLNRTSEDKIFSSEDRMSVPIYASQMAQVVHNTDMQGYLDFKIKELKEAYGKLESAQQQVVQADKLASLGQMVAGVIHDLNNPLGAILMSTQMLIENDGLTAEQKEDLKLILRQSEQCGEIIKNLLQFTRKSAPRKEILGIPALLETALMLVKRDLAKAEIAVEVDVPPDIPGVLGDSTQLQQIFLNLITNARQAMKESKGRLRIAARLDAGNIDISFSDTGCGISPENLEKIFEPFYTTKSSGEGTGLGLSICRDIVKDHGGVIRVESEVGAGTAFHVVLPARPI